METYSRGQQVVVLLIIFGITLVYFHSINQQEVQLSAARQFFAPSHRRADKPGTEQESLTAKQLSGAQRLTLNKPVNINGARKSDLEAIPGIGPKTAEKVIDYRNKHGRFNKIEDIMKVPGIKDKKFEKIKKYLVAK